MPIFEIKYGLGGGFGGMGNWEKVSAKDIDEAYRIAYEAACEEYESYDGLHGLMSIDDIKATHPDWDDDEIEDEWQEQRDSWIEYTAREVKGEGK